jgi:hypothetical protein
MRGLVRSIAEALAANLALVAEAADPSGMHVGWSRASTRRGR